MMRQILITGSGDDYDNEKITALAAQSEAVIASDGGYHILMQNGVTPDIVIGDFDSIRSGTVIPEGITIEKYPPEKDLSDSELAIRRALELQPDKIVLAAVTGRYLDHSLANILNLFRNKRPGVTLEIVTSNATIFAIYPGCCAITGKQGRRLSLFFFDAVQGLELSGFKYQFTAKNLAYTEYSLSNVITDDHAEIRAESGTMICFLFDGGYA